MPQFLTIQAPAFLASYFVNNDASGITAEDKAQADTFLAFHAIEIVSTIDDAEPYFSRFPAPWQSERKLPMDASRALYGDVLEYVARIR